jgi:hypothetical protein
VAGTGKELDTSDWFDSKLPPAREQPEAANLRASDLDADSVEARRGLPDEPDESVLNSSAPPTAPEEPPLSPNP